ncbi:hypothetical protein BRC62_03135 [Halobacteriales archaeon QH_10_67_13]|nr:MAG: hypothetical protein BRC62_03135 [Halobacteriales archaeon QH_10_67_13]
METTGIVQVDAFAEEPLAGAPVAVLTEESLADGQAQRVRRELGAVAAVTAAEEIRVAAARDHAELTAAVGAVAGLSHRDRLEPGEHVVRTADGDVTAELGADGKVGVPAPEQPVDPADLSTDLIAEALGLDPAALRDIGADLPPATVGAAGGTLSVGVNFFEHLSQAGPTDELTDLLEELGIARVCAVTFDTLGRDRDAHVRVFSADGRELPASAVGVAACGAHLARHDVFDADVIVVESGYAVDRPAVVQTELSGRPSISGRGLVSLDGEIALPPAKDDEIIEL